MIKRLKIGILCCDVHVIMKGTISIHINTFILNPNFNFRKLGTQHYHIFFSTKRSGIITNLAQACLFIYLFIYFL